MYISPYTAVDAALAASERAESEKAALTSCDDRATVIDLLSQCNKENVQAPKNMKQTRFLFSATINHTQLIHSVLASLYKTCTKTD